jgi:hypothetical protein
MEEKASKANGVTSHIIGVNGNVFNLISVVSRDLRKAGFSDCEKEFKKLCFNAKSYEEVLFIIQTFVNVE